MNQQQNTYHSGFVTMIGRPNAGKSSLMNRMIGEKIAIVSNKPQTTRNRIMGILTRPGRQIVFLDTPGIHDPRNRLGESMMRSVNEAMVGMDLILVVLDVSHVTSRDLDVAINMKKQKATAILALNKTDLVTPEQVLSVTARAAEAGYDEIYPVSAKTGDGMETLISGLLNQLPAGPQYFPDDMITGQPERNLCAEIIREKALLHLRDEVPHGIGVEIIKMEALNTQLTEINATIYCERDAHKGIIIGKHGAMLQTIGTEARLEMERLLGVHLSLKLWVKVRPDWRNNVSDLRNLGYEV